MRHRDRTAMPCFNLSKKIESSGPRHVASRPGVVPGGGMHSPGNGMVHKMMVRRRKHYLINTVPITIMGLQNWLMGIGVEPPLDHLFTPGKGTNLVQAIQSPA